jgi:hypothetical protein
MTRNHLGRKEEKKGRRKKGKGNINLFIMILA